MAKFLLGWELGANRGHLVRMADVARRLAAEGHEVVLASQRLSRDFDLPANVQLWQAPIWPRLLGNVGALGGPMPNTMGDILVRVGLDIQGTLPTLVQAWRQLLDAMRPDAVAADFAPALLTAARGRMPTLAMGLAFDSVPSHLDEFPSLTGQPAAYPETGVLAAVNASMAAARLQPLAHLPEMFGADHALAGTFTELDVYARWRWEPVVAPSVAHPVGEAGAGEEVFLYADAALLRTPALWDGLARSGLPVRVYAQGASGVQQAELARMGFTVEAAPIPFARIAERSRVVMTYGGLGFTSSALAAGVPVVVVHYDLEKALTGQAITRLQLGGHVYAGSIQPEAFATSLRQLYQNDSFQRRARELAPGFRARLSPSQEELAARWLIDAAG
ncbi:glycosyl transferase-like UDP-glucuronosyltransferase [Sphingomonas sp.]|uniref:glycosyltransferase n=1 Tax=Sphingomonas sp. TaxID=28214 RepID=UPI002DBD6594|nr:glycosyl transferase-like UDP-glucuronosyltransferase [Sphingomonas sp.]HEU4968104.1 glycosyl transferase-like UDP-glucuronosyltransferase [Sphingomonas sp.]